MTTPCDQCFDITCPRGANAASTCVAFGFHDPAANRNPDGSYTAAMKASMPFEARQLDGPHIDRITGHTVAAAAPIVATAAATAIIAALAADTVVLSDVGKLIGLVEKFPMQAAAAKSNLNRLLSTANGAQTAQIGIAYIEIARAVANAASTPVLSATTTAQYKLVNYPLATLFQTIVKNVEKGEDHLEDKNELFDPSTGKKYIPFAKATKVTSDVNLMYSLNIFTTTVQGLTKQAPIVYFRLTKEIGRVATFRGCRKAQEYLDAILRKLDEGIFDNPVALFKSGEQNRLLMDLEVTWGPLCQPSEESKEKKPPRTDPRPRIKFGPVTQPLNGPGAGVIDDFVTKQPKLCTRYHHVPQQPCTAGLPKDHPSGKEGQCAFKH